MPYDELCELSKSLNICRILRVELKDKAQDRGGLDVAEPVICVTLKDEAGQSVDFQTSARHFVECCDIWKALAQRALEPAG